MTTILIPLATGFEEIEAVSLIDILRRADINVITSSLDNNLDVIGANNIIIKADTNIHTIISKDIDMILLPGGWGGTNILTEDIFVQDLIKDMDNNNKTIGAICAAPFALDKAGVLKDKFTCYPSVENEISNQNYTDDFKVIEDNNIITSQGPATAMCMGLYLVKKFAGIDTYNQIKSGLLAEFC
jgi:4-methyl-5(b-hydroxyethyl)-thiazole monophosphate biosynthesis